MTLYHGSNTVVEKPDLSFSRLRTDFGRGFYLTPVKTQAESWARRFLREGGAAILSSYEFPFEPGVEPTHGLRVREFGDHDEEWLNFISDCRSGKNVGAEWDLVIGGVANDKVFDTLQLYFDKLIDAAEAIGRLRYNRPNLQYCFKTQSVIDGRLRFTGSEEVRL